MIHAQIELIKKYAAVDAVNEISNVFNNVNKVIGSLLLTIITHFILIGVSLMFIVAHKINTDYQIFSDEGPTFLYVITIVHFHYKILQISYFGHHADTKV